MIILVLNAHLQGLLWAEIKDKLRYLDFWHGSSVLDCVKNWILKADSRYNSLPIIVSWFIWKARNLCYFEDIQPKTYVVTSLCLGLIHSYPLDYRVRHLRMISSE